jgi:2-polyprenyl-3-methyl-5-hydroxy-6-metoxy-1,4-benzoquinol methylase
VSVLDCARAVEKESAECRFPQVKQGNLYGCRSGGGCFHDLPRFTFAQPTQPVRRRGMGLEHVRDVYEKLGREDPMYAVLTRHELRGNRWDPAAFFQHGVEEIAGIMALAGTRGLSLGSARALDFGAGVGRLTQALADHFDEVDGIDISSTMVESARHYNRDPARVRYHTNVRPDLALLESDTFDFIYSSKTLQHVPPAVQLAYIREFVRVLRPGAIAMFQTRNGPRIRPGSLRARLYALRREHLRRLWQRLRGRAPYEMHYVNSAEVRDVIHAAGGRIIDILDVNPAKPGRSLLYCAMKLDAPAS